MTDLPADLLQHRVPDSRDAPTLNWGILGPGWIAERFIASLQQYTTQNVAAAGERENPRRPLPDSIATLEVMDAIRDQIGVVFPGEKT